MKRKKKKQVLKQEKSQLNNRCENCNSGFTYFRIKTREIVCRNCGNTKKVKTEDKK